MPKCPYCKQGLCDNEGNYFFGLPCPLVSTGNWDHCPDNPNRCEKVKEPQ